MRLRRAKTRHRNVGSKIASLGIRPASHSASQRRDRGGLHGGLHAAAEAVRNALDAQTCKQHPELSHDPSQSDLASNFRPPLAIPSSLTLTLRTKPTINPPSRRIIHHPAQITPLWLIENCDKFWLNALMPKLNLPLRRGETGQGAHARDIDCQLNGRTVRALSVSQIDVDDERGDSPKYFVVRSPRDGAV